jgi:hypothetical protein
MRRRDRAVSWRCEGCAALARLFFCIQMFLFWLIFPLFCQVSSGYAWMDRIQKVKGGRCGGVRGAALCES